MDLFLKTSWFSSPINALCPHNWTLRSHHDTVIQLLSHSLSQSEPFDSAQNTSRFQVLLSPAGNTCVGCLVGRWGEHTDGLVLKACVGDRGAARPEMPAALVTRSFACCWSLLGCGLFPLLGLVVWVGKTLESPPCLRTQSPGRPLKAPFKWVHDYPASQSIGSLFVGCPLCGIPSAWGALCVGFTLWDVLCMGCPFPGVPLPLLL